MPKQMGEDQSDDLELEGPITLRILDGIAWDSPKRNDGGDGRPWGVAAQSWATAPATLTEKRTMKKEEEEEEEDDARFGLSIMRHVSSANNRGRQLTELFRSLMYSRKRSGPSIDPWATP